MVLAPGAPGEYDIRYDAEGQPDRRVMATSPLTVTAAPASQVAPPSTRKGSSISVNWTGPNRHGDYVDLVLKSYSNTSGEIAYFYTSTGPSGSLKAPDKADDYEIRYVL